MEIYNQLLQQFHCPEPTQNLIGQYKHLNNQLSDFRNKRKTYYLIKKKQLQHFQQTKHQEFNAHIVLESIKSIKSSETSKHQVFEHNKSDLKREISQIQSEISGFREKIETINSELELYSNKQQQLQVINKRSQLQVFNSLQQLYIYANRINAEETRQREIVNQLYQRRETISIQIESLLKIREENVDLIDKWRKSKPIKQKQIHESNLQLNRFKSIILDLYGLMDLQRYCKDKKNKLYKKQQYLELNPFTKNKQILEFLEKKHIYFNSNFVEQIVSFHKSIQDQILRNQRANNRLNQHLHFLNQTDQKLSAIIEKETQKKQNQTLKTLKNIEDNAKLIENIFRRNCKVITYFTTIFFQFFKRLLSFKKSIQTILLQADSELINKIQVQEGTKLLQKYEQYLYRNQQQLQIKWNQYDSFSEEFYKNYIQKNDLIRLFANPSSFNRANDNVQNFEIFSQTSFRNANCFLKQLIEEIKKYFAQTQPKTKIYSIKQIIDPQKQFCVQSKQYYRRDNYKLLQKLQKLQLKKKGLLSQLPLNIKFQNQLVTKDQCKNTKQYHSLFTSRKSTFHRDNMKYTSIATKRQENSRTGSVLRRMLSRINSLSNRSFSKRLHCQTINSTNLTLNDSINSFISSKHQDSHLSRFPRNTENIIRKLNPPNTTHKMN